MLTGLAGLGSLPGEQQAVVEEAAEKVEDVQEAVDDATETANGESDDSGDDPAKQRVGQAG
jgi:hypothetical protein